MRRAPALPAATPVCVALKIELQIRHYTQRKRASYSYSYIIVPYGTLMASLFLRSDFREPARGPKSKSASSLVFPISGQAPATSTRFPIHVRPNKPRLLLLLLSGNDSDNGPNSNNNICRASPSPPSRYDLMTMMTVFRHNLGSPAWSDGPTATSSAGCVRLLWRAVGCCSRKVAGSGLVGTSNGTTTTRRSCCGTKKRHRSWLSLLKKKPLPPQPQEQQQHQQR